MHASAALFGLLLPLFLVVGGGMEKQVAARESHYLEKQKSTQRARSSSKLRNENPLGGSVRKEWAQLGGGNGKRGRQPGGHMLKPRTNRTEQSITAGAAAAAHVYSSFSSRNFPCDLQAQNVHQKAENKQGRSLRKMCDDRSMTKNDK